MTVDIPLTAPIKPVYIGLLESGILRDIIFVVSQAYYCQEVENLTTIAPATTPEHPKPANALPIIKVLEVRAAPQITDPSSNIPIAAKKVHLTEP
jgi:hypothetical protein